MIRTDTVLHGSANSASSVGQTGWSPLSSIVMPITSWGRRRQAMRTPFPDAWRHMLLSDYHVWGSLNTSERERMEQLILLLYYDKYWEGTVGFAITDEMRVIVAAMASLLIIGLDYDDFHHVTTVIVAPSSFEHASHLRLGAMGVGEIDGVIAVSGLTDTTGPVVVAWDEALAAARYPGRGRNVVYHEFAHVLDALDDTLDGTPPLEDHAEYVGWAAALRPLYEAVHSGSADSVLRPYAGTDPAEFFACATEVFFDAPQRLMEAHPDAYGALAGYFRQDPFARPRATTSLLEP